MKNNIIQFSLLSILSISTFAQKGTLHPPILLENEQRLDGNPLATYAALIDKEEDYLNSPFVGIYDEVKLNLEQFMGLHESGIKAMGHKNLKREFGNLNESIPENFKPFPAIAIIEEIGKDHQIIM